MSFDGIILVDKPIKWSSFDVVAKIRSTLQREKQAFHNQRGFCMEMPNKDDVSNGTKRTNRYVERVAEQSDTVGRFKKAGVASSASEQGFQCKCRVKVGHTGTLDPLATGLMIVVVGSYCKRAEEFSKLDKTYKVQMKLGVTSTTGDEEGDKTSVQCSVFNVQEIEEALNSFLGESMQIPPAFSAIKIDGKRAYKLAREGKEVKIEPRKIKVTDINLGKYDFPLVDFTVTVSSGTYIRSLVEDIAKKLGTGAYITSLRRTTVESYDIKNAQQIDAISSGSIMP